MDSSNVFDYSFVDYSLDYNLSFSEMLAEDPQVILEDHPSTDAITDSITGPPSAMPSLSIHLEIPIEHGIEPYLSPDSTSADMSKAMLKSIPDMRTTTNAALASTQAPKLHTPFNTSPKSSSLCHQINEEPAMASSSMYQSQALDDPSYLGFSSAPEGFNFVDPANQLSMSGAGIIPTRPLVSRNSSLNKIIPRSEGIFPTSTRINTPPQASSSNQAPSFRNPEACQFVDQNERYLSEPSTTSTSAASKPGKQNRYIDIIHGGIWFINPELPAQATHALTRVHTEDDKRRQQFLPTLENVDQLVSYYQHGSHANIPRSATDSFHSNIGETETNHQSRSIKMTLNREEGSGGNPVESLAKLRHGNGGYDILMTNHCTETQNGDSQVATASRYTRKRRLSTANGDRGESASALKRPRAGSPLVRGSGASSSAQTEGSVSRVAATLTAAPRPQLQPAQPRCLAEGFSQGRLVIEKRERHRKKDGGLTFQVMRPTHEP
ncbi:hypothetical protein JR316_0012025 [Psilocybe cubensis]|uniref:Uncharacterized protein n=2 Tax=Psilocybe cubensis TaxID=181762 RepID=A0A8H7XNG3_PSICU|nr:hypothetical protein JR316_0012025 [Psilocybe cubensis]KAH9474930.1 hypothetical protein JR316_0012025 [Psilocybe cubensis]